MAARSNACSELTRFCLEARPGYPTSMFYELIDVSTGNLIGTYDSENEALSIVRRGVHLNGVGFVDTLALGYEDNDGEGAELASGADLLARALNTDQGQLSRPA